MVLGAKRLGYGGETTRVENRGETTRGETTRGETSWGRNVLLPANKTRGKAIINFLGGVFDIHLGILPRVVRCEQPYMIIKSLTTHNSQ